jgi:hypothetical protein
MLVTWQKKLQWLRKKELTHHSALPAPWQNLASILIQVVCLPKSRQSMRPSFTSRVQAQSSAIVGPPILHSSCRIVT